MNDVLWIPQLDFALDSDFICPVLSGIDKG